jgi:carboxymethylenebutenolidase
LALLRVLSDVRPFAGGGKSTPACRALDKSLNDERLARAARPPGSPLILCCPMSRTTVTITTADARCEASIFRPDGNKGSWPAVLMFMDGIGIRPALFEMGERIAQHGYFVLLPDLFYRAGPYTAPDPKKLFADPAVRSAWFAKVGGIDQEKVRRDTEAFLAFLAEQPDVVQPKIGTTGYCMGGAYSLAAAGNFPDRVAAAASYHGGRLATDAPDSPHRLAPRMKARVYVAGAIEDQGFPDDMKERLRAALSEAKVAHTIETYEGARHGWVPSDTPVHDPAAAERHYTTLFALLDGALKR